MDINTNNNQNQMGNNSTNIGGYTSNEKKRSVGPVVAILIVVLALIVAIIYFIGTKYATAPTQETSQIQDSSSMTANASKADDVNTLNSDLDSQLKDIDYSF